MIVSSCPMTRSRSIADNDPALLVVSSQVERDQASRIDVAYRSFATARREFLVADTPGHEQYTRVMAAAASTADLAVLLIDAGKGLVTPVSYTHLTLPTTPYV